MKIPVWHDDQQGTAGVVLAALYNALELTGRKLDESRIVLFGSGAANIAAARLLIEAGAPAGEIILVDSKGVLHSEREDMDQLLLRNRWKYEMALKTNSSRVKGGLRDALKDADVLIAAADSRSRRREERGHIRDEAKSRSVPSLESRAGDVARRAKKAGAADRGHGRSDFPNQVNNSVLFPAVFRGALDVRARTISDTMVIAAAKELAEFSKEKGLSETNIIPNMLDWSVFPSVAATIGEQAQREGLARRVGSRSELLAKAQSTMERSRKVSSLLMEKGIIRPLPQHNAAGSDVGSWMSS